MPVRKIPKNYRFLTGVSFGNKCVGKSSFESPLERDLQILLEFDSDVLNMKPSQSKSQELTGKAGQSSSLLISGSSTVRKPLPPGGERR